jgi:hypothetical protein
LKAAESEATLTIQQVLVGAVMLYLCMSFELCVLMCREICADWNFVAPFAIDAITKLV